MLCVCNHLTATTINRSLYIIRLPRLNLKAKCFCTLCKTQHSQRSTTQWAATGSIHSLCTLL